MNGFFNRLLRIDLSRRSFRFEELPDSTLREAPGGKALGARLLWDETPVGADPLSPENRFILTTGSITGSTMWSQSRFAAFAKSPATGGFGESYCGGRLVPKIKGCGIDAVVLEGRAPPLSILAIDERGVRFLDAGPIA